jgi:hypothetical protein
MAGTDAPPGFIVADVGPTAAPIVGASVSKANALVLEPHIV